LVGGEKLMAEARMAVVKVIVIAVMGTLHISVVGQIAFEIFMY
jgi:hypothetical protein